MSKICCFTGHRPTRYSFGYNESHLDCRKLKTLLRQEIENAIQKGYDYFISGMALGADMWAAEEVLELRKIYPHIQLEAAIPCLNQEKIWPDASQNRYRHILEQADVIHYVSRKSYKPAFMLQRNKYMIEKSSLVIAVFDGSQGGTKYTLD